MIYGVGTTDRGLIGRSLVRQLGIFVDTIDGSGSSGAEELHRREKGPAGSGVSVGI